MPIHVPPLSRRQFLTQSTALGVGLAYATSSLRAEEDFFANDPNYFALLSDTHIPSEPSVTARDVNMSTNLRQVVSQITADEKDKPAGVIVNGDCAYLRGLAADYVNFAGLVHPLGVAGLPLHLTMGNHDDRGPLYETFANQRREDPPVENKHLSMIESPYANWLLLDSLFKVNVVTGELGDAQLKWLAMALEVNPDKPIIVVAHHNPQFEQSDSGTAWTGMKDSTELFEILDAHPQVKAFIYGHTHNWNVSKRGNIHMINLPPVAYVFTTGKPNGWVDARVSANGMRLKLNTISATHPQNGQILDLKWA
ncbi:MAG: metallophosphoesterase [Pirellulaceae bacterium]